jgi:diacylglycerol kinase family enzyme
VQIVVTPGSGEGRALASARGLAAGLRRRGHVVDVRSFTDLTALADWARTPPPGVSHVVCIGGDATLSAAALAAMREQVPFVPVPNGFGNVFAGVFGYSDQVGAVLRLLEDGEVRSVDVGVARREAGEEVLLSHRSYGLREHIQQHAQRGRSQPRRRYQRPLW